MTTHAKDASLPAPAPTAVLRGARRRGASTSGEYTCGGEPSLRPASTMVPGGARRHTITEREGEDGEAQEY
jgi:hypothetical protein